MPKEEKILRVNVPFRVLPETLEQLKKIAENDTRPVANMFEKLVKDAFDLLPGNTKKKRS